MLHANPFAKILASVGLLVALTAELAVGTGEIRYVTDGDTFRLTSGERIRIANIDAPETHRKQAKCSLEVTRGIAATKILRRLIEGRTVHFVRVGRSYNRTVANVTVDGSDLGRSLIAVGAARPWLRGRPKPEWCH
jgi:micrococcal nuclease